MRNPVMTLVLNIVLNLLLLAICAGERNVFITLPPYVTVGEENTITVRTTSEASKIKIRTIIPLLSNEIVHEETHIVQPLGNSQYGVDIPYQPTFALKTFSPQAVTLNFTVYFCADVACSVAKKENLNADVQFIRRPIIVLGETDKPLYRPGDTVLFRFVVMTPQLSSPSLNEMKRPSKMLIRLDDGNLTLVELTAKDEDDLYNLRFDEIVVIDSAGNRVKVWRDVTPLKATKLNYSVLVDSPEGEWTIRATTADTTENVHFQVRHYVLPRFVIAIKSPTDLAFDSSYTLFSVCSNYTNGPPLHGFVQAQLCVCSKPWDESTEEKTKKSILDGNKCSLEVDSNNLRPCAISQSVVDATGCAHFNVSTQPLGLKKPEFPQWNQVVVVCATVEEEGTKSTVTDCDIGIELAQRVNEPKLKIQSVYKAGLPIYGLLIAPNLATSRVKLQVSERPHGCVWNLRHGSWAPQISHLYSTVLTINDSGVATFLIPPVRSTKSLVVKVVRIETEQISEPSVPLKAPHSLFARPIDDSVVAVEVLSLWHDIHSTVMNLWPTEDSVQYVCPGVVIFQVIANTPLANKMFHIQSNVKGKIVSHFIPAVSENPEPCVDRDNELGHYRCIKPTGDEIECLQGWTGDNCLTPVCAAECHPRGGTCDTPNGCICVEGWKGSHCDTCVSMKDCVHGSCVVGNDCVCEPGWSGYLCDVKEVKYEELPEDDGKSSQSSVYNAAEVTETFEPKTNASNPPVRTLFTRQLQFNLTGDWGPDAMVVVYFYQEGKSGQFVVPTVIKLENMYQCISRSTAELAKSGNKGVEFDVSTAYPGKKIQLSITPTGIGSVPYNTTDETLGLCFLRLSDVSLSNFDKTGSVVDHVSLTKHLRELTTYGSQLSAAPTNAIDAFRSAGLIIRSSTVLDVIEPSMHTCLYMSEPNTPVALNYRRAKVDVKESVDYIDGPTSTKFTPPKPRIRTFFPEVWEFDVYKLTSSSIVKQLTAPDTITSWVASAYCTTQSNGLWVSPAEKLIVTMPFFIDVTLPVHVKRGEILYLPISVFVETKVEGSHECLEVEVKTALGMNDWIRVGTSAYTGCVCEGEKATFLLGLMPLRIGQLNVTVEAHATIGNLFCNKKSDLVIGDAEVHQQTRTLSDMIQRQVRVIPEGIPQELVIGGILHIEPDKTQVTQTFSINLPSNIVADSLRVYVSYTDEILGPALSNLDNLVRLPSGCGEQNMVLVAPSVYVLDYLLSVPSVNTNRTAALIKQARNYIAMGYQRQLNYRLSDGSYSAFGESDKNGSTWLTAFVLRVFAKAYKVDSTIPVDWAMLFSETIAFLKQRQNLTGSGCFVELGRVIHSGMQGGTGDRLNISSEVLLTAYVLTTIAETKPTGAEPYSPELTPMIDAGLKCLKERGSNGLPQGEWLQNLPTYGLAQIALTLAIFNPLDDLAVAISNSLVSRRLSNVAGSGFYWTNEGEKAADKRGALDIETTSYAYLALDKMGFQFSELFLIIRWLSSQQSSTGGFRSTQDTIMALEVITDGAKRIGLRQTTTESGGLVVTATLYPANSSVISRLTEDNKRVVNRFATPKATPSDVQYVEWAVSTEGTPKEAYLSVQTVMYYNVPGDKYLKDTEFILTTNVVQDILPDKHSCKSASITVCLRLPDIGRSHQASGMLLLEVKMVSGWSPVKEDLLALIKHEGDSARSVEIESDGTVSLLFNAFTQEEADSAGPGGWSNLKRCAKVSLKQMVYVKNPQPAEITARDYYEPDRSASVNYSLSECESAWLTSGDIQMSTDATDYPVSTLSTEVSPTPLPDVCPLCELTVEAKDSLAEQMYRGLCTSYNNAFLFSVFLGSADDHNATFISISSSNTVATWNTSLSLADCACPVVSTGNHFLIFSPYTLGIYPGAPMVNIRSTQSGVIILPVQDIISYVKSALDLWQSNATIQDASDSVSSWNCRRIQTLYRYIQFKLL